MGFMHVLGFGKDQRGFSVEELSPFTVHNGVVLPPMMESKNGK